MQTESLLQKRWSPNVLPRTLLRDNGEASLLIKKCGYASESPRAAGCQTLNVGIRVLAAVAAGSTTPSAILPSRIICLICGFMASNIKRQNLIAAVFISSVRSWSLPPVVLVQGIALLYESIDKSMSGDTATSPSWTAGLSHGRPLTRLGGPRRVMRASGVIPERSLLSSCPTGPGPRFSEEPTISKPLQGLATYGTYGSENSQSAGGHS